MSRSLSKRRELTDVIFDSTNYSSATRMTFRGALVSPGLLITYKYSAAPAYYFGVSLCLRHTSAAGGNRTDSGRGANVVRTLGNYPHAGCALILIARCCCLSCHYCDYRKQSYDLRRRVNGRLFPCTIEILSEARKFRHLGISSVARISSQREGSTEYQGFIVALRSLPCEYRYFYRNDVSQQRRLRFSARAENASDGEMRAACTLNNELIASKTHRWW